MIYKPLLKGITKTMYKFLSDLKELIVRVDIYIYTMLGIAFLSVCDICWYNAVPNTCTVYNCAGYKKYMGYIYSLEQY